MSAQTEWPFKDPKNTAVFTTVGVIDRDEPIRRVRDDDDDGAWQFLPPFARSNEIKDLYLCRLNN